MFDKIKRLGKDTAVYGVSTILGRFLTFILTPLYTHILPPDDLGVVATVYSYIAFLNVIYGYGMESAYMKYVSTRELGNERQTFMVPFVSVALSSLVLSAVLTVLAGPVASVIALPSRNVSVITYAAWILFFDAVTLIPFAALRMEGKAFRFATIRLVNIVINVACNILLLFVFHTGLEGIFLSGLISSAATVLLLLPTILPRLTLAWSARLYKALLAFGLPYIPAGLATMMIQVIDRPILEALSGKAAVGIYQANYRLGIFMMLIVSMYDFAWRPFFLSHAGDPDAKQLFARIMTYFVLLMTSVFLVLSFFLGEFVRLPLFWGHPLIASPYWGGLSIVPVVLLAYLFLGVYNNLVAGIYIEKKTQRLPAITFVGAAINIVANYLLIPSFGIMGAAVATLLSYLTMALVLYRVVQGFYRVPYELGRIGRIAIAAASVYVLYLLVQPASYSFLWRCGLLVLFGAMMYWMGFFVPAEVNAVRILFSRKRVEVRPEDSMPAPGGE
jgi:O-antigen/teichoic acid export membrane protein